MRRALQCLALALSAAAPQALPAAVRLRTVSGTRAEEMPVQEPAGYLASLGAPPLRFAEALPPPDVKPRHVVGASPQPALSMPESSVALANAAAAQSAAIHATVAVPPPEPKPETEAPSEPAAAPAPEKPAPSAILPDEMRPQVRPEDFLPYFQIPGSKQGSVTIVAPVPPSPPSPSTMPASSATYIQK